MTGTPTYSVYIDESGDDGFEFPRSSEWVILSAVIVSSTQHELVLGRTKEVLAKMGWREGKILHFGKVDHERRVFVTSEIASMPIVATSVLVHKPSIDETASLRTRRGGRLYNYSMRFLVERVSWYCRDYCDKSDGSDGTVRLVFDHRTHGSYQQIRSYMNYLREAVSTQIHWPVIAIERIDARSPADQICLHLADAVAGGMRAALEPSKFGYTEHRFAKILQPITYRRGGRYDAYGLKFFPAIPDRTRNRWLIKCYGI